MICLSYANWQHIVDVTVGKIRSAETVLCVTSRLSLVITSFFFFFFLQTTITYLDATYRETTMCTCGKLEWAVWIQNQVAQTPKKGNYCENAKWASLFLGILIITECEPENLCSTINAHRLSTPKYICLKEHNFKAARVCVQKRNFSKNVNKMHWAIRGYRCQKPMLLVGPRSSWICCKCIRETHYI